MRYEIDGLYLTNQEYMIIKALSLKEVRSLYQVHELTGIKENVLAVLIHHLVKAGLITTVRKGHYRLRISMNDVYTKVKFLPYGRPHTYWIVSKSSIQALSRRKKA